MAKSNNFKEVFNYVLNESKNLGVNQQQFERDYRQLLNKQLDRLESLAKNSEPSNSPELEKYVKEGMENIKNKISKTKANPQQILLHACFSVSAAEARKNKSLKENGSIPDDVKANYVQSYKHLNELLKMSNASEAMQQKCSQMSLQAMKDIDQQTRPQEQKITPKANRPVTAKKEPKVDLSFTEEDIYETIYPIVEAATIVSAGMLIAGVETAAAIGIGVSLIVGMAGAVSLGVPPIAISVSLIGAQVALGAVGAAIVNPDMVSPFGEDVVEKFESMGTTLSQKFEDIAIQIEDHLNNTIELISRKMAGALYQGAVKGFTASEKIDEKMTKFGNEIADSVVKSAKKIQSKTKEAVGKLSSKIVAQKQEVTQKGRTG